MRMKKTITLLTALACAMGSMAAISEKYNQGYDLESLPLNTNKNETHISLFANNQLMFLQDGKDEAWTCQTRQLLSYSAASSVYPSVCGNIILVWICHDLEMFGCHCPMDLSC